MSTTRCFLRYEEDDSCEVHRAVVLPKSGLLVKKPGEVERSHVSYLFGGISNKMVEHEGRGVVFVGYSEESALVSAPLLGEGLCCV